MAQTPDQKIEEQITQPLIYENDGERVENHSLKDVIEAAKYLVRRKAAKNPFNCMKKVQISTEGPRK